MTTLQKVFIGATLAAAVGTGIYEALQAATLRSQVQMFQQRQKPLTEQIQQLTREREDTKRQLAALRDENERLNRNTAELLKLRGEVGRLRTEAQESTRLKATAPSDANDPVESTAKSWLARVNLLKEHVAQRSEAKIPEFQFLTEDDWLDVARKNLGTEADVRRALAELRLAAENRLVSRLRPALRQYMEANNSQFPTDLSQLQPYLESPADYVMLQRWRIAPADEVRNVRVGGDWIVTQRRRPVDEEYDSRVIFGPNGSGTTGFQETTAPGAK